MKKPEMILFDYGGTLAQETSPDFLRGWRAVFQYIDKNPDGATPEQACQVADSLWQRFSASRSLSAARKGGFETHEWQQLRTVLDVLGLEPALPLSGIECVLMENSSLCKPMPDIGELLAFLDRLGIPTGVVSNIGWSGQALTYRLEKLFPLHKFRFVLASSEYGIRKPDPMLFQIALKKARLLASAVWFCGDDWEKDVCGSHDAEMFPVWYCEGAFGGKKQRDAPFPYLAVQAWRELPAFLGACGG